ncbi:MAG: CHAT domain-containing protein, partial [Holophagales bacterium]|nr:CHAT domain-containing protein [Holophagales bacterium]
MPSLAPSRWVDGGRVWVFVTLFASALGAPVTPRAEPEPGQSLPGEGVVLERRIAGGESHAYSLEGQASDDGLWLTVDQDGIDVAVVLLGPRGEESQGVDSPGGSWGEEYLQVPKGSGGRLEVRALGAHAPAGRYRLWVEPAEGKSPELGTVRSVLHAAGARVFVGDRKGRTEAVELYLLAAEGWARLGRPWEAARCRFSAGLLLRQLDRPSRGLELVRGALEEWRRSGDVRGQAQARMEEGSTMRLLGSTRGVEEAYLEALELWRRLDDLHGEARTLNYLGLHRIRGPSGGGPEGALPAYREALELFRRLGDLGREAMVLGNLGGLHDVEGRPHEALEQYRLALELARRLSDRRQEARLWNNIASVHRRTGRLEEAVEGYGQSLRIRRQLDDRRGLGRVSNNLGLTWLSLGDPGRALELLRQSLELRRKSEDRRGEGVTLHNLGLAHAATGDWDAALAAWGRALGVRRALGDIRGEATTLLAMAPAATRRDRLGLAWQHAHRALELLEEDGNPWRLAKAWRVVGEVALARGDSEASRKALAESVELYRATGDEMEVGAALVGLARAERATVAGEKGLRLAYEHAVEAVRLLETLRSAMDDPSHRASFLAGRGEAFEVAVDLAMELHQRDPSARWQERALHLAERGRARSLLDRLAGLELGLGHGVDPELLGERARHLERWNSLVSVLRRELERRGPSDRSTHLAAEGERARTRLDRAEAEIRRQSGSRRDLALPRPLDPEEMGALLDAQTGLVQFSLGEERSWLWWVSADSVEAFELPDRESIEKAARRVYDAFRTLDPRARSADRAAAARLSEMLLGPVGTRIRGLRLAIVPDGALHYVPFGALPDPAAPGEPLLAGHELVLLPSASALAAQRRILGGRSPAPHLLAVVADPVFGPPDDRLPHPPGETASRPNPQSVTFGTADPAYRESSSADLPLGRLPWGSWEAQRLAGHARAASPRPATLGPPARLALGFDANLAAVRGGVLADHRIVHLATHGLVDPEHPELSALALSLYEESGRPRAGLLRLGEIYGLELGAELVVLSGCRTALGPEMGGEGFVGLGRGFFAAGARRLVASLWKVRDRGSAELMDRFYRGLLRPGAEPVRPAAALRRAQLEMRADPSFGDPYHWAAFALYGDWRCGLARISRDSGGIVSR